MSRRTGHRTADDDASAERRRRPKQASFPLRRVRPRARTQTHTPNFETRRHTKCRIEKARRRSIGQPTPNRARARAETPPTQNPRNRETEPRHPYVRTYW
ncbi:hypothetical protein GY45DRAFT_1326933 [Cubamyces sp. BRFM 1775]|nr:hypothetical protein GY45DRAFT_1326933 [Cubamyces sp. BRFM 1775]